MNNFRHLLGPTGVNAVNTAEGKQRILLLLLLLLTIIIIIIIIIMKTDCGYQY